MEKYEVWSRPGRRGFYGPEYEEERLGTYLNVVLGLESPGAIGAFKNNHYIIYVDDNGSIGKIETGYCYLKPIKED